MCRLISSTRPPLKQCSADVQADILDEATITFEAQAKERGLEPFRHKTAPPQGASRRWVMVPYVRYPLP
jgi:hypothetical protein